MEQAITIMLPVVAFLAAGAIKGTIGIGLPTTAMGLMTLALAPRDAIALILIPMLVSNAWQVYRSGEIARAFRTYLPFAVALMLGVGVTLQLTRNAPDRVLFAVLGASILLFVLVNLIAWAPRIPDRLDRAAQVLAGTVAGVMGGLTSVWAPPMAVYLASRHAPKDEFVRASGLLIFLGSLPLAAGYLRQGILDGETALMSVVLLIPTFAGFYVGERLRYRLSEVAFRKLLLLLFFLMGANLLRRAVMA